MNQRHRIATVFAAAAVLLGAAGAVAAAHPISGAPAGGPVVQDRPDTPEAPEDGAGPDHGPDDTVLTPPR